MKKFNYNPVAPEKITIKLIQMMSYMNLLSQQKDI